MVPDASVMGEAISEVNHRAHLADERGPGDSKCAGHVLQNSAPLTRLNTLGERAERQSLYGDPHWKGVVCRWQILALEVLARLITVVSGRCMPLSSGRRLAVGDPRPVVRLGPVARRTPCRETVPPVAQHVERSGE